MRELENLKSLAERVSRLEERLDPRMEPAALSPISWMRWIPAALLVLVLGGLILFGAQIVLVPLLASVALAYLLAPFAGWLERRGWSRPTASLLTVTGVGLVLALALIFLVPSIWDQLLKSYDQGRALLADQTRVEDALARIRHASPALSQYVDQAVGSFRDPARQAEFRAIAFGWMRSGLFGLVNLTTSIIDLLLIPFFVFYLLSDYRQVRTRIEQVIPPRHRSIASDLIGQLSRVLSTYVRNQMLISLTMGVLYALGFMILRVPLGLTVGLLAGLLNFVPYLGTLTGLFLSLVFVVLDGAGLGRTLGVLGVFAAVQAFEGYFLTPKLLGTSLNLHPMWVLLGLMIGGNLFGLLGIILAVPVIATGKVIFNFFESVYRETDFYRNSGSELLTGEGSPVELITSSGIGGMGGMGGILSPPGSAEPPREPRIIVTTGELRSRRPPPRSSDES